MNGKGSVRRPRSRFVSDKEMQEKWNKVFGKPPPKEEEGTARERGERDPDACREYFADL